jgi:hypothetical protein
MNRLNYSVASLALALAGGCSDEPRGIGGDTSDTVQTDTLTGDGEGDTADTEVVQLAPNACNATQACSTGQCRSGVCVVDPPGTTASYLTNPAGNVPTTDWPDLACVDHTSAAPVQTTTATLYGAVSRFGKGRKTLNIHVDVLLADGFDPTECQSKPTAEARQTCYRTFGTPIGSALSVPANPANVPTECEEHEECPLGYQCFDPNELGGSCQEQFGIYEVQDVPLDTPLILRSYATDNQSQWHDTWVFNVVLHADAVVEGRVQYDAQMVSEGQWILTSNSVGLPDIAPENGAVGGRIRDCGDARKTSWPVSNARLGLATPGRAFVYFNDLEDDTVPLIDRDSTDIIGRFAALDVPAGWNQIAGSARVDGQVVTIGATPVYVAPNMLSIVSWPGTRPYWRQR